jgi:hypothetical protein
MQEVMSASRSCLKLALVASLSLGLSCCDSESLNTSGPKISRNFLNCDLVLEKFCFDYPGYGDPISIERYDSSEGVSYYVERDDELLIEVHRGILRAGGRPFSEVCASLPKAYPKVNNFSGEFIGRAYVWPDEHHGCAGLFLIVFDSLEPVNLIIHGPDGLEIEL